MKLISLIVIYLLAFSVSSLKAQENAHFMLFSGNANKDLAQAVAEKLGMPLSQVAIERFNDGEIKIKIEENIRNTDVYIIQSTCTSSYGSVNDSIMELYLLVRAMKRASARHITAVIPYYGYARQDRKTESRVPISASDIAMLLEIGGVDHVIAVDLHCGQIQGFFHRTPVDNLFASPIFVRYFSNKKDLTEVVVVSPDAGGVDRAKKFIEGLNASGIDASLAVIVKQRAGAGVVEKMNLVGSVKGCDAIIVDDICDTAGTLVKAAKELKEQGARRVFACITHPVFSEPALKRIADSDLSELVVSNTILVEEKLPKNIVQLSIATLLAQAIQRNHDGSSISHLFEYEQEN